MLNKTYNWGPLVYATKINNEEGIEKLLKEHNVSANYFQKELTW